MKVLIISHNVFSKTESMGKTLSAYFSAFEQSDLAQFYIHSEVPTSDICLNYYNITDTEAIKSIITRKCGKSLCEKDIQSDKISSRTDKGTEANLYQKARRRTPLIYLARNVWWGLSAWNGKKFKKWLNDFNPDIVFLASGDYSFIYKIALKIATQRKIPLVVSCMDDYYFNNKNSHKFGGKFIHKCFMRTVRRTMNYASAIFSICEKMSKEYEEFFKVKSYVLHTAASFDNILKGEKENKIVYLGNLGYQRNKQLVTLAKSLQKCESDSKPNVIDIYSSETREEILKDFTIENGIRFHGAVSAEEVKNIMEKCTYLIHTESFDKEIRTAVKYSVSTKIADSLMSGNCLIAFGPQEVASISYLIDSNAAFTITENDDVTKRLEELFSNKERREEIQKNAVSLALKNHRPIFNSLFVLEKLKEICDENPSS